MGFKDILSTVVINKACATLLSNWKGNSALWDTGCLRKHHLRRPGKLKFEAGMDSIFTVSTNKTRPSPTPVPAGKQTDRVVARLRDKRDAKTNMSPEAEDADLQILADQLERLKQHLDELPEVDATRIIQLHNRIQAGTYQINADRLAEKLTALESALNKS